MLGVSLYFNKYVVITISCFQFVGSINKVVVRILYKLSYAPKWFLKARDKTWNTKSNDTLLQITLYICTKLYYHCRYRCMFNLSTFPHALTIILYQQYFFILNLYWWKWVLIVFTMAFLYLCTELTLGSYTYHTTVL